MLNQVTAAANLGHTCHAADEQHLLQLSWGDLGVGQTLLAGLNGAINQLLHQALELGARQLQVQMLGAITPISVQTNRKQPKTYPEASTVMYGRLMSV